MFLTKFNLKWIFQICGFRSCNLIPLRDCRMGMPNRCVRSRIWGERRFSARSVSGLGSRRPLRCVALISLVILCLSMAHASSRIESRRALHDVSADTDPNSSFWRGVPALFADRDRNGDKVTGYRMEVRSRWTPDNLYFLFICPYAQLYLKPDPKTDVETNELWHWNVAEVFIGSDSRDKRRYKEFEVSPQGEWVDLDINLDRQQNSHDWTWNSGFKVSARIDPATHKWYGFMKIPYRSVDSRPASAGNLLRVNFFLSEGIGADHKAIAWQATHQPTFHVPSVFGILKLGTGEQK